MPGASESKNMNTIVSGKVTSTAKSAYAILDHLRDHPAVVHETYVVTELESVTLRQLPPVRVGLGTIRRRSPKVTKST